MIKKLLKVSIVSVLVVIAAVFSTAYFSYVKAIERIPISEVKNIVKENSPNYIEFDEISDYLLDATYAIEDKRFYQRKGIDYRALGRAMLENIKHMSFVEGGSTIDQQLVKIVYYGYQRDVVEKISEFFFVEEMNETYTKEEILEMYVNIINYGDGYVGISEAAKGYFNKEPKDLNLFESSLLAGIPNSPANYQLSNNNIKTYERQRKVIKDMLSINEIAQQEYDECSEQIKEIINNLIQKTVKRLK